MFVEKTIEEFDAMTAKEQADYLLAKKTHETEQVEKRITDEIAKAQANNASKEDVQALQDGLQAVKDGLNAFAIRIKAMSELPTLPTAENELKQFIESNIDKIKAIHTAGTGVVEFELKAVADITTASGVNTSPPAITGTQQAPLGNINLRDFNVAMLTTNIPTSLSAYPYTEAKPKDGDYTFLAEGAIKPQIDFSWETNYAKPVKIAAWLRLTDEAVTDVVGLQAVANDFLRKKHNLKKSNGILFGDGIAPNPKGATVYGRVFAAGAMAGAVATPNFMDVVNACITDISTTHNYQDEMPYMANLVMVNPVDFFLQLVSAKDLNGLPLYPTASLFKTVVIGGVTIIPEESIPTGKIFVADMSKYNTTDYVGYTVKIGWVNDDFIKNQFVILGESRFHAFVKKLDEQAFIYDDVATIKTAIGL